MDLIPSIVNAVVVTAVGFVLWWTFKGRFDEIERRMDRHEAQDETRFDAIERRLDRHEEQNESRFDQMQTSLDGLRSDVTQLAIALGTPPRAENA